MTATLVLPTWITSELEAAIRLNVETAGVLLARIAHTPDGDIRVLGQQLHWVIDSAYIQRHVSGLTIASEGYIHALSEAERLGCTCFWLHTHPGKGAVPRPSSHDRVVDEQICDLFRLRTGSPYYGTLIVSALNHSDLNFTGYLQHQHERPVSLDRLWRVGDRWHLTHAYDSALPELPEIFDRNVRAFGSGVQQTLGDLKVAIVGCGGTGSAVAEQLVRLGVRHLVLIDPDRLSASNVTRVYGSRSV